MLAEPRYKQKWTEDPRNLNWSNDTNKYGYKMLSKMGWSEGKGLGANENGTVSHVKVSKRKENLGFGAPSFHDDNWLAHHDEFSALLTKLNQGGNKEADEIEQKSLQESVQKSQRKILYSKFIKSKDLSLKSKNDLACIFGQRSKPTLATPQDLSEDEDAKSDTSTASCPVPSQNQDAEQGFVTVKSEMNLKDYFAQKMAALKPRAEKKIEVEYPEIKHDEIAHETEELTKKKKKKKKKRQDEFEEGSGCKEGRDKIETVEDAVNECSDLRSVKKKKKSKKREDNDLIRSEEDQTNNMDCRKVSKKKKKKGKDRCEQTDEVATEKTKKSKTLKAGVETEAEGRRSEKIRCEEEEGDTGAKSKKKKRKHEETEKDQECNERERKKKK